MGYKIKLKQGDACYVADLTKEAKQQVWNRFVADGAGNGYYYAINDYEYFEWYFDYLCPTNRVKSDATIYTYEQIMEEGMSNYYSKGSKVVVANQEELDIMNKHGKYTLGKVYDVSVDHGGTVKVIDDNGLTFTWNYNRFTPYKPSGYPLADGSWSSEYKIGDKFVVVDGHTFSEGSIVSFYKDDTTRAPCFKLIAGNTPHICCNGEAGAYCAWERLTPYKQEKENMNTFDTKNLKTGMKVTMSEPYYRGCPEYIVLLDTPTGDFVVNTERNSYNPLSGINLYGKILKVEQPECVFLLKEVGAIKYTTIWEATPPETEEQRATRELQEKYEATKKQLEELGQAIKNREKV